MKSKMSKATSNVKSNKGLNASWNTWRWREYLLQSWKIWHEKTWRLEKKLRIWTYWKKLEHYWSWKKSTKTENQDNKNSSLKNREP